MKNVNLTNREFLAIQDEILTSRNSYLTICVGFGEQQIIELYQNLFDKFGLNWFDCLSDNQKEFYQKYPKGRTPPWWED